MVSFSPNGCFLLDKKEFPLYGISVEKKHKKKGNSHEQFTKSSLPKDAYFPKLLEGGQLASQPTLSRFLSR
ncbi:hypothetical protein, partial [Streptococcus pneumoniae]|uniref:hypothetical protein n=1 Tax=Streptococcus pneumoniae TaxID=1313 RepID=UPI001C903413